ncbi:cadherin domain protein [Necator americanus]|uniref:Cadherin domain protein n=1 Tax=Necator americanus TaxID=51031 RepID=W2SS65_NECAM|nr:cadherin domain protein [Necator americanus]ETN72465.1 cadherin domain protein [Necator americanus]
MSSHPQSPPPWSLSLILSDREGRQKHLSLRILEPNSPVSSEPVKISPLLPIGSKIANFGPKLKEKNKNLYYSLKNQSSLFELDQANGDLYLMRKIRDLAGSEISLYYNLIDGLTSESEEKHVEFEVGSGFVDSPYFTEDFLRIPVAEDTAIGTIIASVNATSPDVSSSIVYRFAEPNNRFSIDQYSGEISVIEDLDWNESPHHLVVVATGGGAKASMLIVVDVLDVNNNHPEIISANEVVTFAEIGTVIHYVVATDDDYGRNATVSYDIITDTTNCFGIDHKTGALSMLRRPPTVDTTIVVRASDHGSPALFADQSLTIRVRNGSKKWSYFDDSELRVTISDAVPIGSIVTTLPVDGKAAIRLFPTSSTFKIDEYGKLTLLAAVNPGTYQLSVLAKSPQGEIDSLSVVVEVTASVKLGPRLSSASCGSISLPENRSLKNFKQIVALNATNEAKFSIRGSTKYFEIDSSTGRLSCPALDREEQSEHLLVVSIQDGDRKDSCTVRITVADENDSAPQFAASTPQVIFINDTVSLQDVVHKFSAFDHDIGVNGCILFDLVEDASFAFDLVPETGDLVLAREPEGVGNDWMIRVKVRDKGVPSLSVDRFVRIQSTRSSPTSRDTQPSFLRQKYVSSIDEGLSRGQIVSKIDGDGVVRTSQELDYEIKDQYDLKIIATGAFSAQIRTQMTVEALPEGSYITTMSANDADNLGALEYSLDPKEERFIIDRYTGIVHLATSLDFETVEEINVDVKVTDGNFTAATSFVVVVMDVNDNAPEFQQRFVDIKIPQSTGADEVIARLVAFDRDSGDNGRVSYTLAQSHELFQLNSNDGTLTLLAPLPADADFLLTVTASDHGFPVMSSSIPVRVTVTSEEAQHRPEFPHTSYE